tara:strand:+ start:445 stop:696 length:252 start_codon:yes stop_codon:yes gene_type:complete
MKSNTIKDETLKTMSKEEIEQLDYYWIPTNAVVRSLGRQIRYSIKDKELRESVINKIQIAMIECEDTEFVKTFMQGLGSWKTT